MPRAAVGWYQLCWSRTTASNQWATGTLTTTVQERVATDTDGDGVPDEEDTCPDSDLGAAVVIAGCVSEMENLLFEDGCTLADQGQKTRAGGDSLLTATPLGLLLLCCPDPDDPEGEYDRILEAYEKAQELLQSDDKTDDAKKAALHEVKRLADQLQALIQRLNALPDSDRDDLSRMQQIRDGMTALYNDPQWDALRQALSAAPTPGAGPGSFAVPDYYPPSFRADRAAEVRRAQEALRAHLQTRRPGSVGDPTQYKSLQDFAKAQCEWDQKQCKLLEDLALAEARLAWEVSSTGNGRGFTAEEHAALGDFWKRFSLPDSLPLDGGGRGWG
jgi:hypothetical protein